MKIEIEVYPLARGYKVVVQSGPNKTVEAYCEKKIQIPQCIKDIMVPHFKNAVENFVDGRVVLMSPPEPKS